MFTAFIFFIGAFETTSSTIALLLYELAKNREIQEKIHSEIDEVKKKNLNDSQINYQDIMDLKYMDCCIKETLRKYPPAPFLMREISNSLGQTFFFYIGCFTGECENDYQVPETTHTIRKGTMCFISTFGIHRDHEFYPQPTVFRPQRFLDFPNGSDVKRGLCYLPFGDGPRICIGNYLHISIKSM